MNNKNETSIIKRVNNMEDLILLITNPAIYKSSNNLFGISANADFNLSEYKTYTTIEPASNVVISKLYDRFRSGDINYIKSYISTFLTTPVKNDDYTIYNATEEHMVYVPYTIELNPDKVIGTKNIIVDYIYNFILNLAEQFCLEKVDHLTELINTFKAAR